MPHPFTVLVVHMLRNIVKPPRGGVAYETVEKELYGQKQERQQQKAKGKRCATVHAAFVLPNALRKMESRDQEAASGPRTQRMMKALRWQKAHDGIMEIRRPW